MGTPFRIDPDQLLQELIQQYPLLVDYFGHRQEGTPDLSRTVHEYREQRSLTHDQLERNLRTHLETAIQPDKNCRSSICNPLPLCPKTLSENLETLVKKGWEWLRILLYRVLRLSMGFLRKTSGGKSQHLDQM